MQIHSLLLVCRHGCFQQWLNTIEESEGGTDNFTKGYNYYGIHVKEDNTVVAREWAPGAIALYLTGAFSMFSLLLLLLLHIMIISFQRIADINLLNAFCVFI